MADKKPVTVLRWNKKRRFGVEFEFTTQNNQSRERFKAIVDRVPNQHAEVRGWERTNDNTVWVCKTDSSCGLEVVSPVYSGPQDLKALGQVLDALRAANSHFDNRCGLHVHIECRDFTMEQLQTMLKYWVKIETCVMNSHPEHRRKNHYCKPVCEMISDWRENRNHSGEQLYRVVRNNRGAFNVQHFESRGTIEFRMGDMSIDSEDVKNRVRFLIWFVELCKNMPDPSNLKWFTPKQVLRFLGLLDSEGVDKQYSPAIQSMREWILARLDRNMPTATEYQHDRRSVKEMIPEVVKPLRCSGAARR